MNESFSEAPRSTLAPRIWMFSAPVLALLSGVACSSSDDHDTAPAAESGEKVGPLDAAAARELTELKSKYTSEQILSDDGLASRFRSLSARISGLDPDGEEKKIDGASRWSGALASRLSDNQRRGWKTLNRAGRGNLPLSWDWARATPAVIELPVVFRGASGAEARLDLESRYGAALADVFERGGDDKLVPVFEHSFTWPDDGAAQVYRIRYRREHRGLPVFGDSYEITLRSAERVPENWDSFLSAHWAKDLATTRLQAEVSPAEAIDIARGSGELPEAPHALQELGVCTESAPSTLCYAVHLSDDASHEWLYYVSATTGQILHRSNQVPAFSGNVFVGVGKPLEGSGKFWRNLPNATIYKNAKTYTAAQSPGRCASAFTSEIAGDTGPGQILGSTNYNGAYANLGDASDTSWVTDFRGPYVKDVAAPPPTNPTNLSIDFTAGGNFFSPFDTTNQHSRRGELFYLLNYSSQFYRNAGVVQSAPLRFYYEEFRDPNCQNPANPSQLPDDQAMNCCGGQTVFADCFEMYCGSDMSTSAHESAERQFRKVMFHEQGHTLRKAAGGLFDTSCSAVNGTPNGTEIGCWEEGRADLSGMVLSHFEKARPEFRPDRSYPGDLTSVGGEPTYRGGSIFESIYADYILHTGVASGMKDVLYNVASPTSTTRMVGSCTDQNGDGYVVASECPADSFYRYLLGATQATTSGQNAYEASLAFHAHVMDADVATAGVQSFPWADETPNQNQHAVYVPLESQTTFLVSNGPDEGSGSLRFDSITDVDTFMFLARGGESYGVSTESLFGGTDTMISVFRSDGSLVASNDDCHPGDLSSCVTFTPATTGYYRIRVSPYNPSLTGPSATYNLRVSMYNDDVADTMSGALALSMRPDAPWRVASLSSGDVDFFKVAVGSSQTLSFQGCSYSFALTLDVYDQNGSLLQTLTNPSGCGTITLGQQAVGAGVYYFRARSTTGAADTYFLRVMAQNPEIDANGPFYLRSTDIGRTYGSQFETEHDQDFYAFSASTEGQWFTIETLGLGINVDTVLEVYAPSSTLYGRLNPPNVDGFSDMSGVGYGQWMLLDDDGGLDARGSRLNFLAPVAGTYYVRVRNKFQSPGEYVIMFEQGTATTTSGWNTAYP